VRSSAELKIIFFLRPSALFFFLFYFIFNSKHYKVIIYKNKKKIKLKKKLTNPANQLGLGIFLSKTKGLSIATTSVKPDFSVSERPLYS
jgi:hypothetical protein